MTSYGSYLRLHLSRVLVGITCVAAALCAQTLPAPRAASAVLRPGETVNREFAAGQSHEYQFTLKAGEYLRVSVEQHTIDVAIACFGPDGKQVLAADTFEIYRRFAPTGAPFPGFPDPRRIPPGSPDGGTRGPGFVIFVGLDMGPLIAAQSEDRRRIICRTSSKSMRH